MSTSTNEVFQQGDKAVQEEPMPEWLDCFLGKTFFEKCPTHDMEKNELNKYCLTCEKSICRHCVTLEHHSEHRLLTIHRHMYQDVVPLSEMECHISCGNIQHFKCNKKWVVSLTPLPHNGSGSQIEGHGACLICRRKLTNCDRFQFCSIACKFQAITGRTPSRIQPRAPEAPSLQERDQVEAEKPTINYRKRSRKGVPHRAPFF